MSEKPGFADDVPSATKSDIAEEKKSNVFVESSAIISENSVIPIYAVLQSQSKQVLHAWGWLIATTIFCAWTTSFTYTVFISENPLPRAYDWSPSLTQQLVNIASHVVVIFTSGLVGAVFDALSWSLASRPRKGTTLGTFLTVQKNTDLMGVGRLLMIPGPQWKWCIMRLVIAAIAWVVGVLLLSHVTVERVYTTDVPFPVTAGLSDLHTSVLALERLNVIPNSSSSASSSSTATIQETGINMMITGSSKSILIDPAFVVSVAPINCTSSDCKSLFLPGGMELVRYQNGSAINTTLAPEDSVIIVNNAPGFQVEYEPSNYVFNYSADCTMYGYDVSSFYSCIKFTGENIISGVSVCPPSQMYAGTCLSNTTYTKPLEATISISLYQRVASVAYDKSNFSIIDVRNITDATSATTEALVADFQKMFLIMYPPLSDIITEIAGVIGDFKNIWPDLAYWSSVFCVQSEIAATQWLYNKGFPTWVAGKQDLLEGLMTIPIQFGTMVWQFVDVQGLPSSLSASASFSGVSYRPRSPIWPIALFAGFIFGLIVWAIICLVCIHISGYRKAEPESAPAVIAAFQPGNPYDVDDKGFWEILWAFVCQIFGKPMTTRARIGVVARSLPHKFLIAVDEK